jgi:hypothetical protein
MADFSSKVYLNEKMSINVVSTVSDNKLYKKLLYGEL